MNKKGFTLVEILIAIVLIGLLFGLAIPGVMKISDRSKEKSYKTKINLVEKAGTFYGESNKNLLNEGICLVEGTEYNCKIVSINDLIEDGYLENENKNSDEIVYENPTSGENIKDNCVYIYIKNNRVYSYYPDNNEEIKCEYNREIENSVEKILLKNAIFENKVLVEDYDSNGNSLGLIKKEEINVMPYPIKNVADDASDSGIYTTSDNDGTSYVFRGTVRNNYVSFAGFVWRIVRINGDGSIRLILNSTTDKLCTDDFCLDTKFNNLYNDNAYVGYMYGLAGTTTDKNRCLVLENDDVVDKVSTYNNQVKCQNAGGTWTTTAFDATHANIKSSTIKEKVDLFYEKYLKHSYSEYLVDSIFCGDKNVGGVGNGLGETETRYAAMDRVDPKIFNSDGSKNLTPTLICNGKHSVYSVSKNLKYPIALLNADELIMSGAYPNGDNTRYYLNNIEIDYYWWALSPTNYSNYYKKARAYGSRVTTTKDIHSLSSSVVDAKYDGIRPVINLKSDVTIESGNGTETTPYVIK